MKAKSKFGIIALIAAAVVIAGIAGVFVLGDSGGSDSDEETGLDETPAPDDDETPEPGGNETTESDSFEATVWLVEEGGETADSGFLRITNESGDVVIRQELSQQSTYTFSGLDPDQTYTVETSDVQDGQYPPEEQTVNPASVDTVNLVAGYEFQGADSYELDYERLERPDDMNIDESTPRLYSGYGQFDDGNMLVGYVSANDPNHNFVTEGRGNFVETLVWENETYYDSPADGWDWEEDDSEWEPPEYIPVTLAYEGIDTATWGHTYEGTETIDGETLDVYEVQVRPNERNATVYVDPDTGYLMRWESETFFIAPAGELTGAEWEIDFYNHDDAPLEADDIEFDE